MVSTQFPNEKTEFPVQNPRILMEDIGNFLQEVKELC